jgi:hypothetical protein
VARRFTDKGPGHIGFPAGSKRCTKAYSGESSPPLRPTRAKRKLSSVSRAKATGDVARDSQGRLMPSAPNTCTPLSLTSCTIAPFL